MPVAEVSVAPVGTDHASYSSVVAQAVHACHAKGLKHEVTAMGTVMEGSLRDILACVEAMHEAALNAGCPRVLTHIAIDHRIDRPDNAAHRVEAVTGAGR